MITGQVTSGREALISLHLRGTNGIETDVDAVLDTGFSESLTLPAFLVTLLALPHVNTDQVILADGSTIGVDLYEGVVVWDGNDRAVIVHCLEGSPLIGMSLLYDHLLTIDVRDGGQVTVVPVP